MFNRPFSMPVTPGAIAQPNPRASAAIKLLAVAGSCLFAAPGCTPLPDAEFYMERRTGRPVTLEGARGPLSAQRSAAIVAELFAQKMQAIFDQDLAASDAIDLDRWEDRALPLRLKE